ncbi:MAG: copper-binding protein [Burkholderiaceae bacterium]|nr:MAG: copper-binding protein [Burkholderiaceae bacterium]
MKTAHLLLAGGALTACLWVNAQNTTMPAQPATRAATTALPLVDGEVRKIDLSRGLIVLRHGDIPNLAMPPMTMGFDVADRKLLGGLKVGDKVKFQAESLNGKATITELQPIR